jgi:hypothetical protein
MSRGPSGLTFDPARLIGPRIFNGFNQQFNPLEAPSPYIDDGCHQYMQPISVLDLDFDQLFRDSIHIIMADKEYYQELLEFAYKVAVEVCHTNT